MSIELRNSLWNALDIYIWSNAANIRPVATLLWRFYFKDPLDTIPKYDAHILTTIREKFFRYTWNEVYDFLQFIIGRWQNPLLIGEINEVLERELSGYRFVSGVCTDIIDKQEIEMLDEALSDKDFPTVASHLQSALEKLADREKPDYRNSIKESISAVEAYLELTTNEKNFDDALGKLDKAHTIHPALKGAFIKIYGYTSDANGIRHAMLEESDLTQADAKFFLFSCTAFIEFLKSRT
jgi:hypothetical protein